MFRLFRAAPEMCFPMHSAATDVASGRHARRRPGFVQGELRSTRLLMPLIPTRFVKYVTPGSAFVVLRDTAATRQAAREGVAQPARIRGRVPPRHHAKFTVVE